MLGASPVIIFYFNFEKSLLFLFFSSLIISRLLVFLYDYMKIDWFSIEEFKKIKEDSKINIENNIFIDTIIKWSKKSKYLLMIFFLAWDPAATILYYREGSYLYNGIPNKKVLFLFLLSSLLSTVVLILGISGLIILWKNLLNLLPI